MDEWAERAEFVDRPHDPHWVRNHLDLVRLGARARIEHSTQSQWQTLQPKRQQPVV